MHVNAIGSYQHSMRELPDELLATATVVVDQREAALAEAGEIEPRDRSRGPAARTSSSSCPRPSSSDQFSSDRTVFKSVGVAIQDWALADLLARRTFGI